VNRTSCKQTSFTPTLQIAQVYGPVWKPALMKVLTKRHRSTTYHRTNISVTPINRQGA